MQAVTRHEDCGKSTRRGLCSRNDLHARGHHALPTAAPRRSLARSLSCGADASHLESSANFFESHMCTLVAK